LDEIELDEVEETLFVPLRGRLYATKYHKDLFYDEKLLEISDKLPKKYMSYERESEYTLMASAIRSKNMDKYVQDFLERHPDGTIIVLGAGLETLFYRNDNKKATWYELDLTEVVNLRKQILSHPRDNIISASMFDYEWIKQVMTKDNSHYMVIASGLFYYFENREVIDLLNNLHKLSCVEIVFDAVSKSGMKRTRKYMKQLGKNDALMYFYVDDVNDLVKKLEYAELIKCEDYYVNIENKSKFKFKTRIFMIISDKLHMVKMIHLKL